MTSPVIWAILVAGGSGSRFSQNQSKLLEPLHGKPIICRSFEALQQLPEIAGMVIVYHPQWQEHYRHCIDKLPPQKPVLWVAGGSTRRDSVRYGLDKLPLDTDIVLVHDAARPLVQPDKVRAALVPVITGQAMGTSLGVPSQNTLKQVAPEELWVEKTLNRDLIWQVHTPQVFRKDILHHAHQVVPQNSPVNDDAELVERAYPEHQTIRMVPDDPFNIKITTPADIQLAVALLHQTMATGSPSLHSTA